MWTRSKMPAAVGFCFLPLLFTTAAAQGDDKPIVQKRGTCQVPQDSESA